MKIRFKNIFLIPAIGLVVFIIIGLFSGFFFDSGIAPYLPPPGLMVDGAAQPTTFIYIDGNENGAFDSGLQPLPNIQIISSSNSVRLAMIAEIWRGDGLPSAGATSLRTGASDPLSPDATGVSRVDRYTVRMTKGGVTKTSRPFVWWPSSSNGKLAIVHHGHVLEGDFESLGMGDMIRGLITDGYTVAGFSMIDDGSTDLHNSYPDRTESLNYLRFFIEPVVRMINELDPDNYNRIDMVGLSGGGWSTHIISAIDNRISRSVSVAGSLPLDCTIHGRGQRDWEQLIPGIDSTYDYTDLYAMAADASGRATLQILNTNDSCCFTLSDYNSGTDYEDTVTAAAEALGGSYDLIWDDTHSIHQISTYARGLIMDFLE